MSHADLKAAGLSGGPSSNKIDPSRVFVVGLDGEGGTPEAKIEWICSLFPKLATRLQANRDPRATVSYTSDDVIRFRPRFAKAVVYETMGVKFPEGCGAWSGRPLLVVNTGRQTTKRFRALNAKRSTEGSPPLEMVVVGRRFESDLDRCESRAVENASLVRRSAMHRAWDAYQLRENGAKMDDIAPLVDVTSGQAVANLIALLDGSEAVQAAVDAGVDGGGITQSAALDIIKKHKGDHAAQDVELSKRLEAAKGKGKRERSQALRGEQKTKPVSAKKLGAVSEAISKIDRTSMADATRVDEWAAIVRWAMGDDAGYDALPDEFKSAVISSEKKKPWPETDAEVPVVSCANDGSEPAHGNETMSEAA